MEFQNVPHLLILAPNWLGDAVMALPAIADVARALPATRIAVAARPSVAPLFTMVPDVHDVVTLDSRKIPRQPAATYEAALLLPNSFQAALAVWRAGIPERWGHRTDWRGALLTRAVLPPGDHVHQAAYYQHLTSGLGFPSGPLEPRVEPSADVRRAGDDLLAAAGWDGRTPLVALAPGAAYGGAKRWPGQSFAELAVALERDGVKSVLVGGAADAAGGAEVVELVRGMGAAGVLNLIGRTDLPALAGVLIQCRALVSNDSGAMHLGAALGVAVTAMFGPTDEAITRPLGRPAAKAPVVISHDVWCRPCLLRECPLTHACMRGISVEAVRGSLTV
jgi:heptosyltransferase-2